MRKYLYSLLLLTCTVALTAQNFVSVSGKATQLPSPSGGVDYVFIFADLSDAEIKTTANANWYIYNENDSTLVQSGVDYLYPEDNTGYIVSDGTNRVLFWVIDYSKYRLTLRNLNVDYNYNNRCEFTQLLLDADIPQMSYKTLDGRVRKIDRECIITFNSLAWGGEQWQDSLCTEEHTLQNTMVVGAPLQNTTFTVSADQFAEALGFTKDSLQTDIYQAIAVAAHPTTLTTVRGTESENQRTNELERPIETTQLEGSAPLDILFRANANIPITQYYQWRIYRGTELIVQRTDDEHRYTFDNYGEYRVVLVVSNDYCESDSMEINVSVALSQLLVPNVFTPNGDGQNDEFRVSYRSIIEFECWVYNRWGKLVYHWTDPAKGWDGNINGRPAAEGAYYYVIRARGADAEAGAKYHKATKKNPMSVGVYQLSGDINLIRGSNNNK